MPFDLSLIPHSKGQRYRGACCLFRRDLTCMHAYRDKKSLSDPTAANLFLPGKRFGSVGRGREATKGRHFLNLMMSQVSFTTVPAQHQAVHGRAR